MQAALNTSVFDRVTLAIERTIHVGSLSITLETRLAGDLTLSGFSRIKLAMCLEEVFSIELPDEVLERFITVADIVKYIGRRYFRDVELSEFPEAA
jgi:acyl carrier protein